MRVSASGPAPPALAWARWDDLRLWPTWSPQIRRVDAASHHLREGLTGVVHSTLGPTVHFTVLTLDGPGHTWSWRVGRGPLRVTMDHAVIADGDGSRASIDLPAALGMLYAPLARLALQNVTAPATGP